MTSIASSGASPMSHYDQHHGNDAGEETDGSWAFVDWSSGASDMSSAHPPPSSVGFFPSPASGASLASYGIVESYPQTAGQAPINNDGSAQPAQMPSPLNLDHDQQSDIPSPARQHLDAHAFADGLDAMGNASSQQPFAPASIDPTTIMFGPGLAPHMTQRVLTPQDLFFSQQQLDLLAPYLNNSFAMPLRQQMPNTSAPRQPLPDLMAQFEIPTAMPMPASTSWDTSAPLNDPFVLESFDTGSMGTPTSSQARTSLSPQIKLEGPSMPDATLPINLPGPSKPIAIRRVRGAGARIEKKKPTSTSWSTVATSSGSDSDKSPKNQFVIVTPNTITAQAGKPNPYECFEALRPSHRGRRGPLTNETRVDALQVRRVGACFCCHARKVKCDTERPCRNCKKLCAQVPQVVCWQFQDFLTVLFPDFVRSHFRKDDMSRFMAEHIDTYSFEGDDRPCTVELYSGARFGTTLTISGQFFRAKSDEVLNHWYYNANADSGASLTMWSAAPIGLGPDGALSQKDEIRKKLKEYVANIIQEPAFAEQVTEGVNTSTLPRRVLQIVHNYAEHSESPIVKRALSIYAMHYIMTRHLTLTRTSINDLQQSNLVPQNAPWVTPRVLNRQLKALLDEYMTREVQLLFENFSKSLKPKSRREWAPCLAAFLVLCLFMEAIETAADLFAVSENEVDLRSGRIPTYKRSFALNINREIEGLPFKQFAYQFHQIYQTHSKDVSAKSFNPLVDEGMVEMGELDSAAVEMALSLRQILQDDWSELDFFTMEPILPADEEHPFPRNVGHDYSTRLLSKFLLSFTDESYIFGQIGQV